MASYISYGSPLRFDTPGPIKTVKPKVPAAQSFAPYNPAKPALGLGEEPYSSPSLGTLPGTTPPPVKTPWSMDAAINSDWETILANADASKMKGNAATHFQNVLRQAYIDTGGGDGYDFSKWADYLDPDTIQKAKDNKFSTMALNALGYEKGKAQSEAELAGRGMLSSGELPNSYKSLLFNREQGDYTGYRNFMSGAYEGLNNLNQISDAADAKIALARHNAADRAAEDAPLPEPATTGTTAAVGSTAAPTASGTTPYTWDKTVTNIAQLKQWLKVRGKTLAQFQASNPAAYARLLAQ